MTIRITRKLSKLSSSPLTFTLCLCLFIIFFVLFDIRPYHHTEEISKSILEKNSSRSRLNLFDLARYELVQNHDIQAPNTCVQSGLKVE